MMTEIVLGPPDTRPVEMTTHKLQTVRARMFAQQLDELATAWADNPAAAFEWMVDAGIAHTRGGMLAPGPCRHLRVAMNGHVPARNQRGRRWCADCEQELA